MNYRMALSFHVPGTPVPQGSKSAFRHRSSKKLVMIDSNAVALKPWREKVAIHARNAVVRHGQWQTLEEGVSVGLRFYLPRPDSVPLLRRLFPTVKPDLDKLVRAVLDSMTEAKVYGDDAKVVDLHAAKFYADDCPPGVFVTCELHDGNY